ncbi:MAG TPA: urate hydroxylase PuuD [Candidatus Elarobacter sp.]|jgi:uncharacterized membrane protein|nr:urate hydroxylase PuuD [Candidatus Elarobacter sp.]
MTLPYVLDWLNLIARWAHVIAGISWIGASFYFVWLDDSLEPAARPEDVRRGILGDLWAVHGGGFYHNQKYPTGPRGEPLSENLHWFKWEAYATWITGMAMLAIVYWAAASTTMIDPSVLALSPGAAIVISVASLAIGWLVYDGLCRALGARPVLLWVAIAAFFLFVDWALFHVFGGRAAYIQVGAIVGTIMVANVFFVIIPGQKRMLAQIRAGLEPDPRPGRLGKMRSVHNTYLTLPVLFMMISNHYPMTYGSPHGWIVLAVLAASGVLVRRFFVLTHGHRFAIGLPIAAAALAAAAAFLAAPRAQPVAARGASRAVPAYADVAPIVARRCAVCHAARPTQPGISAAPQGVRLDTEANVIANAHRIADVAVATHVMPLGNVTHMTDAERATLGAWIAAGAKP